MSLFGDMDLEDIKNLEVPKAFGLPDGVNTDLVISAAVVRTSAVREDGGGNTGLELEISNSKGKSIKDWNSLPMPGQDLETRQRNAAYLKAKLDALEIPVERQNSITPQELVGIQLEGMVTSRTKNGYINQSIRNIVRKGGVQRTRPQVADVIVPGEDF